MKPESVKNETIIDGFLLLKNINKNKTEAFSRFVIQLRHPSNKDIGRGLPFTMKGDPITAEPMNMGFKKYTTRVEIQVNLEEDPKLECTTYPAEWFLFRTGDGQRLVSPDELHPAMAIYRSCPLVQEESFNFRGEKCCNEAKTDENS